MANITWRNVGQQLRAPNLKGAADLYKAGFSGLQDVATDVGVGNYNDLVSTYRGENEAATERDVLNFMAGQGNFSDAVITKGKDYVGGLYKQTGAEAAAAEAEIAQAKLVGDYQSKMGIEMLKNKNRNQQIKDLIAGRATEGALNRAADKYKINNKEVKPITKGLGAPANLDQMFGLSPILDAAYPDKSDSAKANVMSWIGKQNNLSNAQAINALMQAEKDDPNWFSWFNDPDVSDTQLNKALKKVR